MNRSDVFISYRRTDKQFTQRLDQAFKQEGLEVWVDWEDIPPGSLDFTEDIKNGVEGADVFIAILSPRYLESPYCMGELQMAINNYKRIVPLVYEKFDIDLLPDELRHINWVYFTPHIDEANEFEDAFPVLMKAIRSDHEYIAEHTRLLLRAREWEREDRDPSFLLNGTEIDEGESFLARGSTIQPTPLQIHTEYIFASRAHQRAIQRRLLVGVSIAFTLSIALTIASVFLYIRADRQTQRAIENQLKAQSLLWANYAVEAVSRNDTLLAIPLALEANSIDHPPALSQQALASAAYEPGPRLIYPKNEGRVWNALYSPDERFIVSSNSTGQLTLWSTEQNDTPIWQIKAHEGSIWDAAFSLDGAYIISVGADGQANIWNTETGESQGQLDGTLGGSLWSVAFDPRGEYIVIGGIDGRVYVWNANNLKRVRILRSRNEHIWDVNFSDDGRYLAAGGSGDLATLWDMSDFRHLRDFADQHNGDIWSVDFSPQGDTLVTASADTDIVRWEVGSGALIRRYRGHRDRVLSVQHSPNGQELLSSSDDGTIILWEVDTGRELRRFSGHSDSVWSVQHSAIKDQFISSSADGYVIIWDESGGAILDQIENAHSQDILAVAFHPDGKQYVTASEDRTLVQRTFQSTNVVRLEHHTAEVTDVAYSPDGSRIISAGDRRVILWDSVFGTPILEMTGHNEKVQSVDYHPTEPLAISGSTDTNIILWNLEDGSIVRQYAPHTGTVWDVDFSPDGTQFASASADRDVILWDIDLVEPVQIFVEHSNVVRSVAFSPNGKYIASGGDDSVVILRNLETETTRRFTGHNDSINSVEFSPDGQFIVTTGNDHLVIVWDLAGNPLRIYDGHKLGTTSAVYNPQASNMVVSVGWDRQIIFWRADSLEDLITWTNNNRGQIALSCNELERYQLPLTENCIQDQGEVITIEEALEESQ